MNIGRLIVEVGADIRDFDKKLTDAQDSVKALGDKLSSIGRGLTLGVTAPIVALGTVSVTAAAEMDKLTRGLTALSGSSEATKAQLEVLADVAKLPGLGFKEAIQGSIGLQAVGFSSAQAARSLRAFGNALAVTGGGKAELDRVTAQLTQMASAGKILTADLRPIIQVSPMVARALKEAFGTIDAQQIESMGLTFEQFYERLVTQLETLPQATGGAGNALDNLSDAVFRARAAVGEHLLPIVTPLIEGFSDWAVSLENVEPRVIRAGLATAAMAAAAGPAVVVIGSMTTAVAALAAVLGTTLLPLIITGGAVMIALGILSKRWIENKLEALAARDAVDEFSDSLRGLSRDKLIDTLASMEMRVESLRAMPQTEFIRDAIADIEKDMLKVADAFNALGPIVRTQVTPPLQDAEAAAKRFKRLIEESQKGFLTFSQQFSLDEKIKDAADGMNAFKEQVKLKFDFTDPDRFKSTMVDGVQGTILTMADSVSEVLLEGARRAAAAARGGGFHGPQNEDEGSFLGNIASGIGDAVSQLREKFTPAVMAAAGVFAVMTPIFQGFRNVAGPALAGFTYPLQVAGQVLGTLLIPVLRLLFPVLKVVGVVFAALGESIAYLASWVLDLIAGMKKVFGSIVLAVGKFLGKFGMGGDIRKYGRHLLDGAEELSDTAAAARKAGREFEDMQHELLGLTLEDATERAANSLNKLAESAVNVVAGFKIAAYRFGATDAGQTTGGGGMTPETVRPTDRGGSQPAGEAPVASIAVNIQTSGDGRETYREFYNELDQRTRAAGGSARNLFYTFPRPA